MYNLELFKMSNNEIKAQSYQNYIERMKKIKKTTFLKSIWDVYPVQIYVLIFLTLFIFACFFINYNVTAHAMEQTDAQTIEEQFLNVEEGFIERERVYKRTQIINNIVELTKQKNQAGYDFTTKAQLKRQLLGKFPLLFTRESGVYYDNSGRKYTYYSSQVLRHWRIDEWVEDEVNYFWHDKDGYFIVASDDYDYHEEPVIETELGLAKVYDCGTGASGIIDFYVDWAPITI